MIRPNVIVFSESPALSRRASGLGYRVVSLRRSWEAVGGRSHHLVADGGSERDFVPIPVPEAAFSLERQISSSNPGWQLALSALSNIAADEAIIIVDFAHPLRDLFLLLRRNTQVRYHLAFECCPSRIAYIDYAAIGSAESLLFCEPDAEAAFEGLYVAPYRLLSWDNVEGWHANVPSLVPAVAQEPDEPPRDARNNIEEPRRRSPKTRLLLVSYFSGPCRTVGVQRINYWFDELERISDGSIEVHLATATDWQLSEQRQNLHIVHDFHMASVLAEDGTPFDWSLQYVTNEKNYSRYIGMLSYYWIVELEKYFDYCALKFDIILISGNPFASFDFANYARQRWRARVVLDYRDPFAENPRIRYGEEARDFARYVEKGYNLQADLITVVNAFCRDLVVGNNDIRTIIVRNGFDERASISEILILETDNDTRFVHAGSFYDYCPPDNFVHSLTKTTGKFHIVGRGGSHVDRITDFKCVRWHGPKNYEDTLSVVKSCDCGVIFISSQGFETPVKLYDYLGVGVDILICYEEGFVEGAVKEILEDVDGIYWCANNQAAIDEFLAAYVPRRGSSQTVSPRHTRRAGAEVLIAELRKLLD